MALTTPLNSEEIRVLGSLLEKAVTTPDQYPLTLNALTNACNQKSSRDPIVSLDQGVVERTARQLGEKHMVSVTEGKNGVSKYTQRLCNTLLADVKLSPGEYAVLCVLMLRGAQTPGELRTRCARLHEFDNNEAIKSVLQDLIDREAGAMVARLPRRAGRQDHEYAHLLAGEIESVIEEEGAVDRSPGTSSRASAGGERIAQLEARVSVLEAALTDLAERLGEPIDLGKDDATPTE
ncbi:MAG: hypothetical protein ACI9DC_004858 [Gammaproteobacteria bacterium]|jgi:uncharacterized protein YceH (UPF0502 family)